MNDVSNITLATDLYTGESADGTQFVLEQLMLLVQHLVHFTEVPHGVDPLRKARRSCGLRELVDDLPALAITAPIASGLSVCEFRHLVALFTVDGTFRELLFAEADPVVRASFHRIQPVLRAWRRHLAAADWARVYFLPSLKCAPPTEIRAWLRSLPWNDIITQAAQRDRAAQAVIDGRAVVEPGDLIIVARTVGGVANVR